MKVYVLVYIKRSGSFYSPNEIEEDIRGIFSTNEKAVEAAKKIEPTFPDDEDYYEFNQREFSEDDIDYEALEIRDYELDKES